MLNTPDRKQADIGRKGSLENQYPLTGLRNF